MQLKPLPAVPPPPPPPALEETPENLLDLPPEEPSPAPEQEAPANENEDEPTVTPQDDPNATSSTQPVIDQLIQPSEINIAAQIVEKASLVVTPEESLRRHGEQIQVAVTEMERIICDLNHLPPEHFSAIADIAAQPEAASDLADLAIAAFAQSKFLVESVRTAMVNGINSVPSNFGGLCDNCAGPSEFRNRSASEPLATSGGMETDADAEADNEGDNLYCEIEPIKDDGVSAKKVLGQMEINENYSGTVENGGAGIIRVEKIAASITSLNLLVSQLTVSRT